MNPFNMDMTEYRKSRRCQRKPTLPNDKTKYPKRRLPDPYEESYPHSCWSMAPFRSCMGRNLLNYCDIDHNHDTLDFTNQSFEDSLLTEAFTTKLHVASSLTDDYIWKGDDLFGRSDSHATRQTADETAETRDTGTIAILHGLSSFDRHEETQIQMEELEMFFVPVPSEDYQAAMMKNEARGCENELSFPRQNISNREVALKTISIPEKREDIPHAVCSVKSDEVLHVNPDDEVLHVNPDIPPIPKNKNQSLYQRQRDSQCPRKNRTKKQEEDENRSPPPYHEDKKKQISDRRRNELAKSKEANRSIPRSKNRPNNGKRIQQPAAYHRLYAASSVKQLEGKRRRAMLEKSYREKTARRNGQLVKDTGKISIEKASKLYDRCMSSKKKHEAKVAKLLEQKRIEETNRHTPTKEAMTTTNSQNSPDRRSRPYWSSQMYWNHPAIRSARMQHTTRFQAKESKLLPISEDGVFL